LVNEYLNRERQFYGEIEEKNKIIEKIQEDYSNVVKELSESHSKYNT
jgi:hypothetical protein